MVIINMEKRINKNNFIYKDNVLYYKTDTDAVNHEIKYTVREVNTPRKLKIAKLVLSDLINKYKYIDCCFGNLLIGYGEEI